MEFLLVCLGLTALCIGGYVVHLMFEQNIINERHRYNLEFAKKTHQFSI